MKIIEHMESDVRSHVSIASLARAFFQTNPLDWRFNAEIDDDYYSPGDLKDAEIDEEMDVRRTILVPKVVVKYGNSFLRHSAGPRQGHFWDVYPDDYKNWGLAFKALVEAPPPPAIWVARDHELYPDHIERYDAVEKKRFSWKKSKDG